MSDFVSIYATANAEETPKDLTPMQLARRKQWAIIVCLGAQNETSKRLAQRLCRQWFPNCNDCELMRGKN